MRVVRFAFSPTWLLLLILAAAGLLLGRAVWYDVHQSLEAMAPALFGKVVVIDAGHGGYDPGVLGTGDSQEADINLVIAKKLEEYCRQAGMTVLMSRTTDQALADTKAEDLRLRAQLGESADLFISLHCNGYPDSDTLHGVQVFYQKGNEAGQLLAETIQSSLQQTLENTDRTALPHSDSYLLKHITAPAAIVEMGFLSNPEEETLLQNETYQWQMAWGIYQALNTFFQVEDSNQPTHSIPEEESTPTSGGNDPTAIL